jgi:phosphoribosylformylglycinamidine cyclo-ligase
MYQVFNMGTRMEIYTDESSAEKLIAISKSFGVDAQLIGRVEDSEKKELVIINKTTQIKF